MPEIIKVPPTLYARLAKHAQGFDTPAHVIQRLLDAYEAIEPNAIAISMSVPRTEVGAIQSHSRKYEKYLFESREYGKGRLVLAVVSAYVKAKPSTSYSDLLEAFPKRLQGSHGVFESRENAERVFERTGHKRHYINPDELLRLSDDVIAVSTQWGIGNIDSFIERASVLGFDIIAKFEGRGGQD